MVILLIRDSIVGFKIYVVVIGGVYGNSVSEEIGIDYFGCLLEILCL